jgi:hypothetical protein
MGGMGQVGNIIGIWIWVLIFAGITYAIYSLIQKDKKK